MMAAGNEVESAIIRLAQMAGRRGFDDCRYSTPICRCYYWVDGPIFRGSRLLYPVGLIHGPSGGSGAENCLAVVICLHANR